MHSRSFKNADIRAIYETHPLQEKTIVARILAQKGTLAGINELELAVDCSTEITDQNHVGGLLFVKDLADRARVSSETEIIDLGCGLAGSARCLAHLFGCRVHGVDLSPKRCKEARNLTKLVGLQDSVSIECADFTKMEVPQHRFDVMWGQSAWVHVVDKLEFVSRWSSALRDRGRIAFEDAYLRSSPQTTKVKGSLARLEDIWKAQIVTLDCWFELLEALSYRIKIREELTDDLIEYLDRLIAISQELGEGHFPVIEEEGWNYAKKLIEDGVLGYVRIVAEIRK